MDPTEKEILEELKKINMNLGKINHPGKHMWTNFIGGAFHTLGGIFGTLIIVSIVFYLLSRVNLSEPISRWIEDTLTKVRWEKITNTPMQQQIQQVQQIENNTTPQN